MEVLRRCPLAIAQRLVHCAIALSTAVLDRVTKTMSVAPLLMNNLDNSKQKTSNLLSPAPPPYSWSLLGKRTVQLTAVRDTSRNDGRWKRWDSGLQTPENSSFGYFTNFILYFTDFILFYRFYCLFYRFYFTEFIVYSTDFIVQILILFDRFYLTYLIFYFTDFILKIITELNCTAVNIQQQQQNSGFSSSHFCWLKASLQLKMVL